MRLRDGVDPEGQPAGGEGAKVRYCLSLKKIFLFLGNIWEDTKSKGKYPPSHKGLFLSFFFAFSICFRPHFRFLEKKDIFLFPYTVCTTRYYFAR